MPTFFEGIPTPLKIVLTTVDPVRPAALLESFGAAIAAGAMTRTKATDKAINDLLLFIMHQISVRKPSLDLYFLDANKEFLRSITSAQGIAP
jgi:hypothetical protein